MNMNRLICETDAAWDSFCAHPSDATWELYVMAKAAEDAAQNWRINHDQTQKTT